MPRDTLKIDRFEGGVNTKADRRDIDDNQATRIVDGYVATPGKITLSGGAMPFVNELDSKVKCLEEKVKLLEKLSHPPREFVVCDNCKCKIKEK